jgi:hypothetical protein
MLVGSLGRQFDFVARLIQQLLGLSCMALHVPLVGYLGVCEFGGSLVHEFYRGSQVRVPFWTHSLGNGYATCDKSEDQRTTQNYITDFHGISSRNNVSEFGGVPVKFVSRDKWLRMAASGAHSSIVSFQAFLQSPPIRRVSSTIK